MIMIMIIVIMILTTATTTNIINDNNHDNNNHNDNETVYSHYTPFSLSTEPGAGAEARGAYRRLSEDQSAELIHSKSC